MSKKNVRFTGGLVYSTHSEALQQEAEEAMETLAPEKQNLRVSLDSKQRAGKIVTLVQGFIGKESDLESLGKKLKNYCGTGGSVKDGLIIIQGDCKLKVMQFLQKEKYKVKWCNGAWLYWLAF